jgi:hypothetical protein
MTGASARGTILDAAGVSKDSGLGTGALQEEGQEVPVVKRPVVIGLLCCEQAIVEERTWNITLVNCFTRLKVSQFPSAPQRLVVFTALTDGLGEGTLSVVVAALDTLEAVLTRDKEIQFADPLQEVRVLFRLNQVSFPRPGAYQVTLLADGELVAQRTIHLSAMEELS